MSSWLSLNPFKSQQESPPNQEEEEQEEEDQLSPSHGGGVKEDLSELGKTLSRQLWGVASFLAPPPPPSTNPNATATSSAPTSTSGGGDSSSSSSPSFKTLLGIRNDFAEISGSLKSGFSLISTNKAVNEISRLATNLLQFDEEKDEVESSGEDSRSGVVGITEEVLEFVKEISLRRECWIDFPLPLDDYEFDISNAHKEHALTVEDLAPSLADLRMELCPSQMKDEHFWMIYFILLHPRLNKHDSELLSTAQIVEARDILLQAVQNRPNAHLQASKAENLSLEANDKGNNLQEEGNVFQEKEVLAETVNAEHQEDADVNQWLEEDVETGTSFNGRNQLGNEQDVSFSDLEDDDSDTSTRQVRTSIAQNVRSSPSDASGWVQPTSREKDSEGEESNDWLTIDEFDSDSVDTA